MRALPGLQVGYCQSMNYLAAMLLLALGRDEESAFWVLVCLIDDGGARLAAPAFNPCPLARSRAAAHVKSADQAGQLLAQGVALSATAACAPDTRASCLSAKEADARRVCAAAGAAGILYRDMYAQNLVGAHVEMRSLEARPAGVFYIYSLQG
jgi:hypothetical protein